MVEFEVVFNPEIEKNSDKKDKLIRSVKDFSDKIGENSSTSLFMAVEDAINSKSKIFLIRHEDDEEHQISGELIDA